MDLVHAALFVVRLNVATRRSPISRATSKSGWSVKPVHASRTRGCGIVEALGLAADQVGHDLLALAVQLPDEALALLEHARSRRRPGRGRR